MAAYAGGTGGDPARSPPPDAGEPVGDTGLKPPADAPAGTKRMWASRHTAAPGRAVVSPPIWSAAEHGHTPLRSDISSALEAAIGLDRSSGFQEVPAFHTVPCAHDWCGNRIAPTPKSAE